jgi:hypothetical protein
VLFLDTLLIAFAVFQLTRYLPAALQVFRRRPPGERPGSSALVPLMTVLLAFAVLTVAMIRVVLALIRR